MKSIHLSIVEKITQEILIYTKKLNKKQELIGATFKLKDDLENRKKDEVYFNNLIKEIHQEIEEIEELLEGLANELKKAIKGELRLIDFI